MNRREIYLAGGCYWGAQKYLSNLAGVLETEVGFANGNTVAPSYEQVKHENTGHAETVRTVYDADVIPLRALLRLFYKIIDPTTVDRQGEDEGHQYRTGVYYTEPADAAVIAETLCELGEAYDAPIAVENLPLDHFYPAEEYHQKYLDKNPNGYCHVPLGMMAWAKTVNPQDYAD